MRYNPDGPRYGSTERLESVSTGCTLYGELDEDV
jgi:hypothetical protein